MKTVCKYIYFLVALLNFIACLSLPNQRAIYFSLACLWIVLGIQAIYRPNK